MCKEEHMRGLVEAVEACRNCELWRTRSTPVPGEGSLNANVIFIGEAPGHQEDLTGRPFVGAAGNLLDELFSKIGLSRNKVYISNIVKCRPPENRDPRRSEIEACTLFLDKQIRIINPKLIVTLGRHSTSYILSKAGIEAKTISKVHGRTFNIELFNLTLQILPAYHPAAALYNPKYKTALERDFQFLKAKLENNI